MSTKLTNMSYVKEVLNRVVGNTNEANAAENQRLASSAIEVQQALAKAALVSLEGNLRNAKKAYDNHFYGIQGENVVTINVDSFVQTSIDLEKKIEVAQLAIDDNKKLSETLATMLVKAGA